MTISLTTPFAIPNCTRWMVTSVNIDDNNLSMLVTLEFRSPAATSQLIARCVLGIYNLATGGLSSKVIRTAPLVGGGVGDILSFSTISLPTGYDDAVTAWRGGANATARKNALETFLLTSGIVDSSLTGT